MVNTPAPVITIDGPASSGKGTLSRLLAQKLHWHFLDSGALYRILAFASSKHHIAENDVSSLEKLAGHLNVQFLAENKAPFIKIIYEDQDISQQIRQPECGSLASHISVFAPVRTALLEKQREYQKPPGLVADGRDMGTVVFPKANLKFFLIASAEERAKRRYLELQEKSINVSLERVLAEIKERDRRDTERNVAPLKPAEDAFILDTTTLSIPEVLEITMKKVTESLTKSI